MIMDSHEFHMMQLADSFFPSGNFGFSGGLESFVRSGSIKEKKMSVLRRQKANWMTSGNFPRLQRYCKCSTSKTSSECLLRNLALG